MSKIWIDFTPDDLSTGRKAYRVQTEVSAQVMQAVRNEVVAADAVFLQKEIERLSEELAEARGGAVEAAALRAELAAASAAGSHLAEELAAAESAVRATQVHCRNNAQPWHGQLLKQV